MSQNLRTSQEPKPPTPKMQQETGQDPVPFTIKPATRARVLENYLRRPSDSIVAAEDYALFLERLTQAELREYVGELFQEMEREEGVSEVDFMQSLAWGLVSQKISPSEWLLGKDSELLRKGITKKLVTGIFVQQRYEESPIPGAKAFPKVDDASFVIVSGSHSLDPSLLLASALKTKPVYFIIGTENPTDYVYRAFQDEKRSMGLNKLFLYPQNGDFLTFASVYASALVYSRIGMGTRIYVIGKKASDFVPLVDTLGDILKAKGLSKNPNNLLKIVESEKLTLRRPFRLTRQVPTCWVRPLLFMVDDRNLSPAFASFRAII